MMTQSPADEMSIAVRAYVALPPTPPRQEPRLLKPSDWSLTFDCETTTDPAQRLRFGVYQIHKSGLLQETGFFYDPAVLKAGEQGLLISYAAIHQFELLTVEAFVDSRFFGIGFDLRATIVGFNLSFDLSRLARDHVNARGKVYQGGFSFGLNPDARRPRIQSKHLSRRASLIRFAAPAKQRLSRGQRRRILKVAIRRGYFVDVNALGSALTGQSHSLESLSGLLLDKDQVKTHSEAHGKRLTVRYIEYALRDVEATWACYQILAARYHALGLTQTLVNQIYSEASIGKASLKAMHIRPWREVQPDFPPEIIGNIASSYFGGRSDVNLRREIRRVVYCDFVSMYPTVCTLMRLWQFVIASGIAYEDTTEVTQHLLDTVTSEDLRHQDFWLGLTVLVQVKPDEDLLPVRARYDLTRGSYTIGLNSLTSQEPLWYTLADCIVAKIQTGKAPRVVKALRFRPLDPQPGLKPLSVAGRANYRIKPAKDDFYRRLIELRMDIKARHKTAKANNDALLAAQLDAEQQAIKIMANATSYGIFFELNVTDLSRPKFVKVYGHEAEPFSAWVKSVEEPGRYFHPLLAALITGAARLMLALCEHQVLDAGLDWAFCDTDSMAIAKPHEMQEAEFLSRALRVQDWFSALNPYGQSDSILKVEDVNFRPQTKTIEPLYCFAISPKRYTLFNLDKRGRPIIRKAMAHGLGHLKAPYTEKNAPRGVPMPKVPLSEIGVSLWQHHLWHTLVGAALDGHPDSIGLSGLPGFDAPAVSQYAATTPNLLAWFDRYNADKPYAAQVKPNNFLLMFQVDEAAWRRSVERDEPCPGMPAAVAPYSKDLRVAARACFDRRTGAPVPTKFHKSIAQALSRYHLHPEPKYRNADYTDIGRVTRRRLAITHVEHIGKEAHRWEEQLHLGEIPEAQLVYQRDATVLEAAIRSAAEFSQREIAKESGISLREVSAILRGQRNATRHTLMRLAQAVRTLSLRKREDAENEDRLLGVLREKIQQLGVRGVARELGIDAENLRKAIGRQRRLTKRLRGTLERATA